METVCGSKTGREAFLEILPGAARLAAGAAAATGPAVRKITCASHGRALIVHNGPAVTVGKYPSPYRGRYRRCATAAPAS